MRTVTGRGGGPEKTLLNSHRHLNGDYSVRLAYLHPRNDSDFDLPERAVESGADLLAIGERGPWDLKALSRLMSEVKSYRPAILHAHDYKTDILAVLLSKWTKIPVVTTLHGNVTLGGRLNFYYRLERWAWRRMQRVMAVSRDLMELAVEAGVPAENCRLIENGIDLEQFRRTMSVADAKRMLGLSTDELVIGGVGRLMPEKGFDVLLRAFASIAPRNRQLRLVIAGEGPERSRLAEMIEQLGLKDRAILLGHRTDVANVLQACDMFVLSSRREGSPNAVLEAMAMETPIIATSVAGVSDMLESGVTGLLIPDDNADELAGAMQRLAVDAGVRSSLAAAARRAVETRYDFADRMRKECAVYDELLVDSSSDVA